MKVDFPIIDSHALLGEEYHLRLDATELLRRMDAHGIETAIARPMGAELAVSNREGNDRVLKTHARIRGMASVNPWFGAKALDELKRCRELGAVGLFLHPSRQGFMPTDDAVRPLLDFAAAAKWPVMFHTGSYVQSDLLAVGEVARKYPHLSIIAGFGGFTDMWFELPGVMDDFPNLVLDTSMMWGDAIKQVIEKHPERVVWAAAEPRNRYAVALNMIDRIQLSPEQLRAAMRENARRIFKLP